jgi:hypothetical protein
LLPIVKSANSAWQRKQQKGADIGSVVHDAIEHYVLGNTNNPDLPSIEAVFDIAEQYMWNIKEAITDIDSPEYDRAMAEFESDVAMANKAFEQFKLWWDEVKPVLYGAEDLLYSLEHNVCGTYDGDIGVPITAHPVPELFEGKDIVRCTSDWKTSNASSSKDAAAPEGVYYSYFVQLAIYELCRREMGFPPADDLLTVSARKDGGFSLVYASELGLTVQDCIDWAVAVVLVGFLSVLGDMFFRMSMFGGGNNDNGNKSGALIAIVAIVGLIIAPIAAQLMQLAISRRREFLADASGALITRYPEGLASALEKISSYQAPMQHANSATAHLYISNPFGAASAGRFVAKLFATHPPAEERIAALRSMNV